MFFLFATAAINLRANRSGNDEANGTQLVLKRIPITTGDISDSRSIEALALLRTSEKPALPHCRHGAGTGLVSALCRTVEQGWTKEDALAEMEDGGYGFHSIWTNTPKYVIR